MKFSDDTVLLTLLQGSESDHGCLFTGVTKIDLNVNKTKELIIDLSKNSGEPKPNIINVNKIEIVLRNKYLGTLFDSQLKCDKNIESIVKRGQQRIHLLRKLNFFNVYNNILCMFYQTFIESILTFPFIFWFGGLPVKDKNSLFSIVKVC